MNTIVCPSALAFFQPQPTPLAILQLRLGFAAWQHDAVSVASSQFCASENSYGQRDTSPQTHPLSRGGCESASTLRRESHTLLHPFPTAQVKPRVVPHSTCFSLPELDGFSGLLFPHLLREPATYSQLLCFPPLLPRHLFAPSPLRAVGRPFPGDLPIVLFR